MKPFFMTFPCILLLIFAIDLCGQQATYISILNYTLSAGAKADFKRTGNGFLLTSANEAKKITVSARFWHPAAAQQKLAFRITGDHSNKTAKLRPVLFYRKGTQELSVSAPPVPLDNSEPKEHILGLDTDFGLSDAVFNFCRLDLILEHPDASGSVFKLENARIANAGELSRRNEPLLAVPPVRSRKTVSTALPPDRL